MKIQDYINQAGGNLARPTKFTAMLSPPSFTGDSKIFDILCKTAGVPETTNTTIDLKIKGHDIKIPGRTQQQQEITVSFYLSEDHQLRKVFYDWVSLIDNRNPALLSGKTFKGTEKYGSLVLIARDFSESNTPVEKYTFERLFPTGVSGFEFNSEGVNDVMEFTVTFSYYRFNHTKDTIDNSDTDVETYS